MQGRNDLAVEALQEALRQGLSQMRGDSIQNVGDLQAEAAAQNGGEVTAPIGLVQRHRQDPLADDLAVDDHAVAIADEQIEGSFDLERLHEKGCLLVERAPGDRRIRHREDDDPRT